MSGHSRSGRQQRHDNGATSDEVARRLLGADEWPEPRDLVVVALNARALPAGPAADP